VPGVFAAGDVRQGSIKRVASGVGEGATVVRLVHEYLSDLVASAATVAASAPHAQRAVHSTDEFPAFSALPSL
jgi:thioredoxin reductase (NADPH)